MSCHVGIILSGPPLICDLILDGLVEKAHKAILLDLEMPEGLNERLGLEVVPNLLGIGNPPKIV